MRGVGVRSPPYCMVVVSAFSETVPVENGKNISRKKHILAITIVIY